MISALYIITGILLIGCGLYYLWQLSESPGETDFFIPGEPAIPSEEDFSDDLVCIKLSNGTTWVSPSRE
jgi:hypothetical protein